MSQILYICLSFCFMKFRKKKLVKVSKSKFSKGFPFFQIK